MPESLVRPPLDTEAVNRFLDKEKQRLEDSKKGAS